MEKNKIVFKTVDENDSPVELAVLRPTAAQKKSAQLYARKVFRKELEAGTMLRSQLQRVLTERGMWDDERQKEREKLENIIRDGIRKIKKGGNYKDCIKTAMDIRRSRVELMSLLVDFVALDNKTVEAQEDNAAFDYLVSVCTVYNHNGEKYFTSLENYLDRGEEKGALEAASNLYKLVYDSSADKESELPENVFLKKCKLIDDKLRLINKEGHLVDEGGRLINEDGRYVTGDGKFCDVNGNLVDEDGAAVEEFVGYFDDEGNPIKFD